MPKRVLFEANFLFIIDLRGGPSDYFTKMLHSGGGIHYAEVVIFV